MNENSPDGSRVKCHVSPQIDDKDASLSDRESVQAAVCGNLNTYKHTDGNSYCILHLPSAEKPSALFESALADKISAVEGRFSQINKDLAKALQMEAVSQLKYDFRYVWFPTDKNFSKRIFVAKVDFSGAVFNGAAFFKSSTFAREARFVGTRFTERAIFSGAKFLLDAKFLVAKFTFAEFASTTFSKSRETDFELATFEGSAWFDWSTFGEVNFKVTKFSEAADFKNTVFEGECRFEETNFSSTKEVSFYRAKFSGDVFFDKTKFCNKLSFNSTVFGNNSDIIFRGAEFHDRVSFRYATSEGYIRFIEPKPGPKFRLRFDEAAFEKATRISFHTTTLYPHWFVNVDPRKFVFTDVNWRNLYWEGQLKNRNIDRELLKLEEVGVKDQALKLLSIATRQLAVNSEENNLYEDATKFRYMSMESRRLEDTKRLRFSRLLTWLYKWTSGYGESWSWALLILFGIWLLFGIIYWLVGDFGAEVRLNFWQGLGYSSNVMLFQKPDIRTNSDVTFTIRTIQTIAAPLQAALLALAIRRKFMR